MANAFDRRIVPKLNRAVSDARCWIAWQLFRLASKVTDASVHSCGGEWTWRREKVPNA